MIMRTAPQAADTIINMKVICNNPEQLQRIIWLADLPGLENCPPATIKARLAHIGYAVEETAIRGLLESKPRIPEDLIERVRQQLGPEAVRGVELFLQQP